MNDQNKDKLFLPHFYEPIRREIATRYAQHEFRKLLPQLREESLWKSIDQQIENWYEELSERNFWNAIHGISMGFRLKSLVPLITSLNLKLEEKEVPIEEFWFGGKFDAVGDLGSSESASDVKEKIFLPESEEILKDVQERQKNILQELPPEIMIPHLLFTKKVN